MRGLSRLLGPTPPAGEPWYGRDGGARFRADRALIDQEFSGLRHLIEPLRCRVYLEGDLVLRGDAGVPERIAVRVEFPDGYPAAEPMVYDAVRRFPHIPDRHFYGDGRCCLWIQQESRWDGRNPDGLRDFLHEAAIFFDRQLVCDVVGYFPGPQRSHGTAGYIEFAREVMGNDDGLFRKMTPVLTGAVTLGTEERCPCGSGRRYGRCHGDRVEQIFHNIDRFEMQGRFRHVLGTDNR